MVGLMIAVIAYLVADHVTYGANLIYTFDALETWYFIILIIFSVIAVGLTLFTTILGTAVGNDFGKSGMVGGSLLGAMAGGFFSFFILVKIGVQYWLTIWLMENIDPAIVSFDDLSSKNLVAMGILLVLALVPMSTGSSSSSKSSD